MDREDLILAPPLCSLILPEDAGRAPKDSSSGVAPNERTPPWIALL